tara:strand:- start:62 stop:979 length:918 start_codon:yes stop_codon:yes gene_type:complete
MARVVSGHSKTILELIPEWIDQISMYSEETTVEQYERGLRLWVKDSNLADETPSTVSEKDVHYFINKKSDRKASTRKIYLQSIRSFFKFACNRGHTLHDPSALNRVKLRNLTHEQKEPKKIKPVTSEDVDKILTYVRGVRSGVLNSLKQLEQQTSRSPKKQETLMKRYDMYRFWETAVILAHETALRFSDIAKLEWSSFKGDNLIVWTEKRDTRVEIPISARLRDALLNIPIHDLTYCFPEPKNMGAVKLSTYFKRIAEKSDVFGKSFHGLRHGTLQRWKEQGFTLEDLAKKAGHTSTKTTEGYL